MTKGMIGTAFCLLALMLLPPQLQAQGKIWKVVDENGNVIYTDQQPRDGSEPMDLPELSVIQSDIQVPKPGEAGAAESEDSGPLTPRELRRKFSDFRITQPQPEETFWGTANKVVVGWGASEPIPPEMNVMLYVDGQPQKVPGTGGVTLTLDRGEHQVYAELRDARNRRIVTTDTVTFYVKQYSSNFNRPAPSPAPGS